MICTRLLPLHDHHYCNCSKVNNHKFDSNLPSDDSSFERILPPFYVGITMAEQILSFFLRNGETCTLCFLKLKNQIKTTVYRYSSLGDDVTQGHLYCKSSSTHGWIVPEISSCQASGINTDPLPSVQWSMYCLVTVWSKAT